MDKRITFFAMLFTAFAIGLSSSVFLMPFWIPPFLAATKTNNPSDWIGFAGNFAAGIMTIVAAVIAWFAVQGQISAQEDIARIQTALQKTDALNAQIEALEYERLLFWKAAKLAAWCLLQEKAYKENTPKISFNTILLALDELRARKSEIEDLIESCALAGIKQWRFPKGVAYRDALTLALLRLAKQILEAQSTTHFQVFKNDHLKGTTTPLPLEDQEKLLTITLANEHDAIASIVHSFNRDASNEISRLVSLVVQARRDSGS